MTLDHRAFLYDSTEDFLSGAAPFLTSGLEAGNAVVAVIRGASIGPLRDALGDRAKAVEFHPAEDFYQHPVRTLKKYQELVKFKHPRTVCALAEPVWDGRTARERLEWARYESLINVAFGGTGARALCPYDCRALPPEVIRYARSTHPQLTEGGRAVPNSGYVQPADFGADCDRTRRFERPRGADYLAVESDDLYRLRTFVAERALAHGLDEEPARNLVTAANEAAANALRHGSPPTGLWMWAEGPDLYCEVGDNGLWRPDALVGFVPPDSAMDSGFGLWTVRLLVDLMELRAGWDGTFVRMRQRR